jgi:putative peptide zinc metalloprotease protein
MGTLAFSAGNALRPRLRADLRIIEQVFRGESGFVVKDPTTQKYFRFRPVEVGVMRQFDGAQTVDEIADRLTEQGTRLTGRAVEGFARKLASIGLMERSLAERTTLELERIRTERRKRRRPALFRGEILRMRWSFGDPDRLFDRLMPSIRWMFTRGFVIASGALFAVYFLILGATWNAFSQAVVATYSPSNITLGAICIFWITSLTVIMIHELGHGFACKHFGGEVHELGLMIIYFQVAFYCNVNDAWSFPTLRSRLWVTAAGGWIQFVVASLAAVVWFAAKQGTLLSEIAVAAMITGGAMTLVTNANPLLPLDGYFALTDWLEIPNLRLRALAYFKWWLQRHIVRVDVPEPSVTDREKRVFMIYGALSFAYTILLFSVIGLWVVGKANRALGVVGALLTVTLIAMVARRPLAEMGRAIGLTARRWRSERKGRAWWRGPAIATLGIVLLLAVLPWTLTTSGKFVVAPAVTMEITAPDSAVIGAVFVREGMRVETGAPLLRLVDNETQRAMLSAARAVDSLSVATSRARAAQLVGNVERLEAERAAAVARFAALRSRVDALTLRARSTGTIVTPRVQELEGKRVDAGDAIVRVATLDMLEARVSLGRAGAASVRPGGTVHLIAYGDANNPVDATVGNVASAGDRSAGTIEIRVPVRRDSGWRAGATGEASVDLRKSTALVALWWNVRQLFRNDMLL